MTSKLLKRYDHSYIDSTKFQSTDDENSMECCDVVATKTVQAKYKTQMCKNYSQMGYCPYYQKCRFAHGEQQLFSHKNNIKLGYRSRRCKPFWETGRCRYGPRCQFSHEQTHKDSKGSVLAMMKCMIAPDQLYCGSRLGFCFSDDISGNNSASICGYDSESTQ